MIPKWVKPVRKICFAGLLLCLLPEPFNYLSVPFGYILGVLFTGYMLNLLLTALTKDSSNVSR